jgi:hypothetical protein
MVPAQLKEITMKRYGYDLSFLVAAVVLVGLLGCGQEAPTGKAGAPGAPAVPSKSATESAGQAVVDSIKTPLDKAGQVEKTLEKGAERTADTVKEAAP